jgi:inhibitor of cysteine peptidase
MAGIVEAQDKLITKIGREFSVQLESNPTTGYKWEITEPIDKKLLLFVKSEYTLQKPQLTGSGGIETWVFKALKRGHTTIKFSYARSWEKDTLPIKTKIFHIVIKR